MLSAFWTLEFSSLIVTKNVPMIEKTMPSPQMTIGSRIGDIPPKASFDLDLLAEHHRREDRRDIRTKKIGTHAGNVADVVADVVGDRRRIANVVLGNAGLDLTDEVGTDVSRFCIDTAADTREQVRSTLHRARNPVKTSIAVLT